MNEPITQEASEGFNFASPKSVITDNRRTRRNNIIKMKKYLPKINEEMLATQEAFEKNYPGFIDTMKEDDVWELLNEENKTRKALFYRRLFEVEIIYTALVEYIKTKGKRDILREMNMKFTEDKMKEVLEKNNHQEYAEAQV